jgi:hypothetical protein
MLWRIQEKLQTRRPSARMGKLLDADTERPSSPTRPTMTTDCNESGMAGLGAAPGSATAVVRVQSRWKSENCWQDYSYWHERTEAEAIKEAEEANARGTDAIEWRAIVRTERVLSPNANAQP